MVGRWTQERVRLRRGQTAEDGQGAARNVPVVTMADLK
jgi:hypothetical protein